MLALLLSLFLLPGCAPSSDTEAPLRLSSGPLQATLGAAQVALRPAHAPGELTVTFAGLGRQDSPASWLAAQPGAARWGGCAPLPEPDGTCARQLAYTRAPGVEEWWVARGGARFQQGWTLHAPPPAGQGLLRLEVRFPGSAVLQPLASPGRARIRDGAGQTWRYDGLLAWDADGRALPAWMEAGAGGEDLAILVDDTQARYPVTVDPIIQPEQARFTASDAALGDGFGQALARAGDLDGDGYEDVLVGAPGHLVGGDILGAAYVYSGAAEGLLASTELTLPAPLGQGFGATLSGAGDINGDGYDDIIIGGADDGAVRAVAVYYGSASGIDPASLQLLTDDSGQGLGAAVAGAGDVDGDGYADVLVGVPQATIEVLVEEKGKDGEVVEVLEEQEVGAVYLYFGSATGLEPEPQVRMAAEPEAYAEYGAAVLGAGDLDEDGYADVVVGAPGYNGESYDIGAAYVCYGGAGGLDGGREAMLLSESVYYDDAYGQSLAAGDLDGDGHIDVLLGSQDEEVAVFYGTASGIDTDGSRSLEAGDSEAEGFGQVVASGADVDGDGYMDLVAGADDDGTSDEGAAYFLRGGAGGPASSGAERIVPAERGAFDYFGASVALADIDGDGFADLLVGAPNDVEGAVHVFGGEADQDGDGLGASADCDDADAGVGEAPLLYRDQDEDGYGDLFAYTPLCPPQEGYVENNDDCDDEDADIHPAQTEVCEDNLDQDCDGLDLACEPSGGSEDDEGSGDGGGKDRGCAALGGARGGGAGLAAALVVVAGRRRSWRRRR